MPKSDLTTEYDLYLKVKSEISFFDQIYKYFLNDVYRFSYSLLGNQHDAEDLTSNAFIEFYKKFPTYEWQNKSMKSWLFTTTKNLAMNKFRLKTSENIEDENTIPDETEISFVDEIIQKDLLDKIQAEIKNLNPIERSLINLRIWEGLSFAEIGEINQLSEDAARMKFNRTISKLRKILEEKHIKALALPILFTGLLTLGQTKALAIAPTTLSTIGISTLLKTTMHTGILTTIKGYLGSKAGIAVISIVATGSIIAGGTIAYTNLRPKSRDHSASVTPTPTSTITPTEIATITPTKENIPEVKKYSNDYLDLVFSYPEELKLNEKKTDGIYGSSFVIKLEKGNSYLSISNYLEGGFGSGVAQNANTVKILLDNGQTIYRDKVNYDPMPDYNYEYRSYVENGTMLDSNNKAVKSYSYLVVNGRNNYFITAKISDTTDLTLFDSVIKTLSTHTKTPTSYSIPKMNGITNFGYKISFSKMDAEVVSSIVPVNGNGFTITAKDNFTLEFITPTDGAPVNFSNLYTIGKTTYSDSVTRGFVKAENKWYYTNYVITSGSGSCGTIYGVKTVAPCGYTTLDKVLSTDPKTGTVYAYFLQVRIINPTPQGLFRADEIMKSLMIEKQ